MSTTTLGDLDNESFYHQWRARKLQHFPKSIEDLIVEVRDLARLTTAEKVTMHDCCMRANMVIYRSLNKSNDDKGLVRAVGAQFGLHTLDRNLWADDDAISSITVTGSERKQHYIPYTNKALNWHTDGYYNSPDKRIRAFIMHCVQDAKDGGENYFLDHEIAYILLRDNNKKYIDVLSQPDAMTIPDDRNQKEMRHAQQGPIFCIDEKTRHLYMRYTARARNVIWKDDPLLREAIETLTTMLATSMSYSFIYRLRPGEGVICNNVLHGRTAYADNDDVTQRRLLYRARYYERIQNKTMSHQEREDQTCYG